MMWMRLLIVISIMLIDVGLNVNVVFIFTRQLPNTSSFSPDHVTYVTLHFFQFLPIPIFFFKKINFT